jgi:putative transposase
MLDAGLLDEVMRRAEAGELALTREAGFLPEMVKAVLQRGLQAELTEHLGYEKGDPVGRGSPNSRNGAAARTLLTEVGPVRLDVPRDRVGTFDPRLVPKGVRRAVGLDVRDGHQVRNRPAHIAVGVDLEGIKHVLGTSRPTSRRTA